MAKADSGIVFDIMKYSIHDGPGIRNTVFLKGCPLHCIWCHNPESQKMQPELFFLDNRCMGCLDCVAACPLQIITPQKERLHTDLSRCDGCGKCEEVCPTGAREISGKPYTPEELLQEVEKDRVFYEQSGGGVTFSGGEPLSQPEFLLETLKLCKERGLHTVVDTCGIGAEQAFRDIIPYTDLFLYDLKLMDDEAHIRTTGASNKRILENLGMLIGAGCPVWVRLPIIPGINDTPEHINAVADFLEKAGPVERITLLAFHNISKEKYRRLEMENRMGDAPGMEKSELKPWADLLVRRGFSNVTM